MWILFRLIYIPLILKFNISGNFFYNINPAIFAPMNKEILRLAIPNIISNISVPLLSTVDTALMGRMSALHLGAVGLGAMIFNFLYWNFAFLRMGTTGMTAQAFGEQNKEQIVNTLGRAILVVFLLAGAILLLQKPLGEAGFVLMNVTGDQLHLVKTYFYIRIWAAPATLGLYAIMGWFFGMQNAIYPLILTVFINFVNIVLSFLFVYTFKMDVDGVAWSTVIAQYAGCLLGFALLFYKYKSYNKFFERKAVLEWKMLKQFLVINRDIFIRTVCLTLAFALFYSRSAEAGATLLAANVILLQFLNWMSYGVDGFAFAAESLVGKYAGAKDELGLQKAVKLSSFWGTGLAVGFSLLYGFGGNMLLHIFTNKQDVIDAAITFLPWMVLLPLVGTPCYIWDGIFIGLTASREMRNSMLLAFVIYLVALYAGEMLWVNHGLWMALLIFLAARGVCMGVMYALTAPK